MLSTASLARGAVGFIRKKPQRGGYMVPRRIVLVCAAFIVFSCLSVFAQNTSSLEGTVTDPTGAVVPNATVTIKNEETGASQSFQTKDSGYYRFTILPAALFTIS